MSFLYCISDDYLTDICYQHSDAIASGAGVLINEKRYISSGDSPFPRVSVKSHTGGDIDKKISLLSGKTMQIIGWMCQQYYSSIRKVLPLRLPYPLEMIEIQSKRVKKGAMMQEMIIVPDVRTAFAMGYTKEEVLHSASTKKQWLTIRKNMKYGLSKRVITTGSQSFLEFESLEFVKIIDERQRYYKNQQDPRYHIIQTSEYLSKIYGVEKISLKSSNQ